MLKAVIFDMDGVIIDSEPLHARANILALQKYGVTLTLDYVSQFIGNTILAMCESIQKDYHLDLSAKDLSQESAYQIEMLHLKEGYTPIPYVKELIEDLHRHGIKLAIASSSTIELIEKITDVFEIRPYFTALISGLSVAHSKPAPDIFLKACEELDVTPEEAIIIEDSTNGVLAATRANIKAIGYVNSHSGNQDLSKACYLIEGFEEIDYYFIKRIHCHAHNIPADIVETDRLFIRELGMDDIPTLYELYQDETFQENHLVYAKSLKDALEKHEAYMKHMYHFHGFGLWGVFLRGTKELIGHCGIELKEILIRDKKQTVHELCYGIKKEFQQQGYGKEATRAIITYAKEVLYLNSLYALIAETNISSIALASSLGFSVKSIASHVDDPTKNSSHHNNYILYQLETMVLD